MGGGAAALLEGLLALAVLGAHRSGRAGSTGGRQDVGVPGCCCSQHWWSMWRRPAGPRPAAGTLCPPTTLLLIPPFPPPPLQPTGRASWPSPSAPPPIWPSPPAAAWSRATASSSPPTTCPPRARPTRRVRPSSLNAGGRASRLASWLAGWLARLAAHSAEEGGRGHACALTDRLSWHPPRCHLPTRTCTPSPHTTPCLAVWTEVRNFKKCLIQMFMKQVGCQAWGWGWRWGPPKEGISGGVGLVLWQRLALRASEPSEPSVNAWMGRRV